MSGPDAPRTLQALVVASWFPAVDESSRGRFIADQVEALARSGRVRPMVVSFETVGLTGPGDERRAQAEAIERLTSAAVGRDERRFSAGAVNGPVAVPIARIPVAGGGPGIPTSHPAERRRVALRSLATSLTELDLIHAHTAFPDGAGSIELARGLGVPLVITEHASFVASILADPPRRAEYERAITAARRFIAVSETLGRELAAAVPGLGEKLVVIPNAVDGDSFQPLPLAARRPDELLYVGYRIESKGLALLLRAFREVRAERPTATLRLIGRSLDDETEEHWHDLARSLGVADAVSFEPPALRPDIAHAMARASVLVHASARETFGMTAVEALASGTPVVALDSGGVTETLGGDPRLGEIVATPDPAALAAAILRTLDRRSTFDPEQLRASAIARFGDRAVAARLTSLYDEVLAEAPVASNRAGSRSTASAAARSGDRLPVASAGPRALLVTFVTHRAERIVRTMPRETLGQIEVLCAAGDAARSLPAGLARVTSIDIDGPFLEALGPTARGPRPKSVTRRILRAARDPIGTVRRRRVRAQREQYRLKAGIVALAARTAELGDALGAMDIVGVDGIDYLVASRVPAATGRIAPGGPRWLADQLAAAHPLPMAGATAEAETASPHAPAAEAAYAPGPASAALSGPGVSAGVSEAAPRSTPGVRPPSSCRPSR